MLVISITRKLIEESRETAENGEYKTKRRKADWLLIYEINIANYLDCFRLNEKQK